MKLGLSDNGRVSFGVAKVAGARCPDHVNRVWKRENHVETAGTSVSSSSAIKKKKRKAQKLARRKNRK